MKSITKQLALLAGFALFAGASAQEIRIDGSSTVYPINLALAEEFQILEPAARIVVAFSGTGAGFEKFCRGETEVSGASRPIKEREIELCARNGIDFVEIPVAADGISVVVNPSNDWAECLTMEELHEIWRPGSTIDTWQEVRPGWPDRELILYGPGTDSGTFDYFTEAVNEEGGAVRTDFFPSEDDNVLVQGVAGDVGAMGFFGYAYYAENQDRLDVLGIDSSAGCVEPKPETIADNSYAPLSRPLFLYFAAGSLQTNEALKSFARFTVSPEARPLIADTGYLPYPPAIYEAAGARLEAVVTGSSFLDFEPGESVLDAVRPDSP